MIDHGTPIRDALAELQKSKEVTAQETKGIDERTPPYDGVHTWGDLLVVRGRLEKKEK